MVFGLFSKEKTLQRTIEKATNKLAQQPDRWGAMERLKEDGSEAALFGLCRRFGITSLRAVEDEQEKSWVVEALVERSTAVGKVGDTVKVGGAVLEPLRKYMTTALQLAFPLKVLERIVAKDKALEVVDELLAKEPPGYTRDVDRRIDLVRWLGETPNLTDDEVATRLAPYLTDFDENVRFAAIDGLASRDAKLIADPLIGALVRPEEESGRIKLKIAGVLAEKKIPLGERAAQVASGLTGTTAQFAVKSGVLVAR